MPQGVVARPIDARECLPLVQQGAEPVHATTPVIAQREGLGLGDHALLGLLRHLELLRPLGLAGLGLLGQQRLQCVQAGHQRFEVTDSVRAGDTAAHRGDAVSGFLRRKGAALDPRLQQTHLHLERLKAAGVEGKGLAGLDIGNLTDRPLAFSCAHVHRAVSINATEVRRTCGGSHGDHLA